MGGGGGERDKAGTRLKDKKGNGKRKDIKEKGRNKKNTERS